MKTPLPKRIECQDRVFPVKRRKKVVVDRESARGSFQADKGIEIEKGPEEVETLRHEVGHAAFEVSGLTAKWRERIGADLADQLEEDVCGTMLPLYRATLERNGL